MSRVKGRSGAVAALVVAAALSHAQYAFQNVALKARVSLTTFGATAGNDCWGYVSPSGREYAFMGCNNRTAFVEITNPASPNYFAAIDHPSSTWSDIKVYGRYAYVVSEAAGTGIQVIDLGAIDAHVVTLVRTIPAPDRSHNVAIDTVSGFLYTLGSRGGSGTTTCWSLADPANPVQVGPASMTLDYMHDAQIVTYTSGPYAGKQIFFGSSASRGVDIYDVTDKNNPVKLKRLEYPNIGYCHQSWLSADKKTLYTNDEMDETGSGYTTRTLVFDVTDFNTASYVTSFTSGVNAIDHNLYVRDGFLFEANYRSGLRIFDSNDSATAPVPVGFFDTYPANNDTGYDGAWSNFPFFPSGTVIVSDINRGLFILDPSAALTRNIMPASYSVGPGLWVSGGLGELASSDDQYFVMRRNLAQDELGEELELRLEGTAPSDTPNAFSFLLESRAPYAGIQQRVWLWDWVASQYVLADTRTLPITDTPITVTPSGNLHRFVQPGTLAVRAKITLSNVQADTVEEYQIRVDRAVWRIVP